MADRRSALQRIQGSLRVYDPTGQQLQREIDKTKYPISEGNSQYSSPFNQQPEQQNQLAQQDNIQKQMIARSMGEQGQLSDADKQNFQASGEIQDPKLRALQDLSKQMDDIRRQNYLDTVGGDADREISINQQSLRDLQDDRNKFLNARKDREHNLGRSLSNDDMQKLLQELYPEDEN